MTDYSNWQHVLGASSALLSALMWAIAAVLFAHLGKELNARALNLGKGLIAAICLAILLLPSGIQHGLSFVYTVEQSTAFWYLALSGLLGIAIGDTLYFLTLQRLGAKLTLLVGTLIPVVTALSAIVLFDETITLMAGIGLTLTISGVFYVLWMKAQNARKDETKPDEVETHLVSSNKALVTGIIIGFLYILSESGGILLTKLGLNTYDSIEATFIRQVWGVAGLMFWGLAASSLLSDFAPLRTNRRLLILFVVTSFIGAFLGTWLSIIALEFTYTAVAVSLNSTSPLFVLPIAYWFLKEKLSKDSVIGAIIAVSGVAMYFFTLS